MSRKNGVINSVYNVGKIKEEGKYSLRGSRPVTDKTITMRSSSSTNSISKSVDNVKQNNEESSDDVRYSVNTGRKSQYGSKDSNKQFSQRYWYPNMSKSELDYVKRRAAYELNNSNNYIDNENKWLYNEKNGKTFFALYSTADEREPTILYACKGTRAEFEQRFFSEYIIQEENTNGETDSSTKVINRILDFLKSSSFTGNVYSGNSVGRNSNNGNVGVYSKNSRNRPSEALLDCLRNISETQERNGESGQYHAAGEFITDDSDTSQYSIDTGRKKKKAVYDSSVAAWHILRHNRSSFERAELTAMLENVSKDIKAGEYASAYTKAREAAQVVQLAFTDNTAAWAKKGIGSVINAYDKNVLSLQKIAIEETRLGIPILFSIDCIHGHALNSAATVFPNQLAMASSFDRNALKKSAQISAKEALCDGIRFILSPVLDIARDIRWGRISETFGEDPFLAGELGAAMVQGYECEPVISCPKHFIAHSESKGGRDSYEVSITDRKVRQFFMPPFAKAVNAGCGSIMSGQQVHNGRPMCVNQGLINGMLKEDTGFEGFVITDNQSSRAPFEYGVAKSAAEGFYQTLMSGNDMVMFCSKDTEFAEVAVSLAKERPEFAKRLDDSVLRILTKKFEIGLFENPYLIYNQELMCCEEHYSAALDITRKSITMLKNDNNILPLDSNKIKSISVVGPAADNRYSQYGDWTYLNMPFSKNDHTDLTGRCKTYYQAIKEKAIEKGITVAYSKGCDLFESEEDNIDEAIKIAQQGDIIIACFGDNNLQNGEHRDRAHLELSGKQNQLFSELRALGKPIIVILSNGKPLIINEIAKNGDAILECFNGGIAGGVAAAEIIFGEISPSGRLPISFPRSVGQLPVYYNYMQGWHADKYIDEDETPLYHFGFGLTYTTFEYKNLELKPKKDGVYASVIIKNIGNKDCTEVAQLYVRFINASFMQPVKSLKGFERVDIKRGETKNVEFFVPYSELSIIQENGEMRFEGGIIEFMVGSNSQDKNLLKKQIEL